MNVFEQLAQNKVLLCAGLSWLAAQVIKVILHLVVEKKMDWSRMVGMGGMPSSHTAFVFSMCLMVGIQEGFATTAFAIAFTLAAVVIYDAMGVRAETGKQGAVLNQAMAVDFAENYEHLLLICGHYEGIDERIIEEIVDKEVSIGDFVITGGELGALVLTDAVGRLCDGVLSEDVCFEDESHFSGLLEYPQYTRPQVWHGKAVPEVLLSGNHKMISDWRHEQAVLRTMQKRPDMLKKEE